MNGQCFELGDLGLPVVFDAPHCELQLDGRWLATLVAGGDAVRLAAVRHTAEQADAGPPRSVGERAHTSPTRLPASRGRRGGPAVCHQPAAAGLAPGR
ncbi:MAG: hypothetical protein MUF16_27445 [Burkholderiaceae bacterium]|nr:hypothetical protein [Burkholderiaceae bacterium]